MILYWNCRGCSSMKFVANCKQLVSNYKPFILSLTKTWICGENADKAIQHLGFNHNTRQKVLRFSRGICLLWNDDSISIYLLLNHRNLLHVHVSSNHFNGFPATICYSLSRT